MDGRDFLEVARRLSHETTEADWRSAAGRAYYALMLEGREALRRWGFTPKAREEIHRFVRLHFIYPQDPDLRSIGAALEKLLSLRNHADYRLDPLTIFVSAVAAQNALVLAHDALALLDAIDSDPIRRGPAITTIQRVFPP